MREKQKSLIITPFDRATGVVQLPGSKSISNRALLLAALAHGVTRLHGVLDADDTRYMIESLRRLGVSIRQESPEVLQVYGTGGAFDVKHADLFVGNAGTAARTLTAALAFAGGDYTIDGVGRMRERPIKDLVDALEWLGAKIEYLMNSGYPPLRFSPAKVARDNVSVCGNVSSQYLTALLMVAPVVAPPKGLQIQIVGDLISRPYVDMTCSMMRAFGAEVQETEQGFWVGRGSYQAIENYVVEADASGASYFLALGALARGPVRILGVGKNSLQGDVAFADVLERMGARIMRGDDWIECASPDAGELSGIEVDCLRIPDAAMTLVPMALATKGSIKLTGIGSWRVKETDRLAAMACEMRKFGALVEEGENWISVTKPRTGVRSAVVDTYDDHRMAMSLSLAAAAGIRVTVCDPECTAKTFPTYFDEFDRLCPGSVIRV